VEHLSLFNAQLTAEPFLDYSELSLNLLLLFQDLFKSPNLPL
jgi:hypothetical protein